VSLGTAPGMGKGELRGSWVAPKSKPFTLDVADTRGRAPG